MLYEFIEANRAELIARCREQAARCPAPAENTAELEFGVPLFLHQLTQTLKAEQDSDAARSLRISGASGDGSGEQSEICTTGMLHGRELSQHGFTITQVVRSYGDICQAISGLAVDIGAAIDVDEFMTLNRCLDNAIAGAVTEHARHREQDIVHKVSDAYNERFGFLAHEMRNFLHTATLGMTAIKLGGVGVGGATGALVDRSLLGLRSLIDRALADVRATAGMPVKPEVMQLDALMAEINVSAWLEAKSHSCVLVVPDVEKGIEIEVDRETIFSALSNLLQNAFKFTGHLTEVTLRASAHADRVLIEIFDHCGGLPDGAQEKMFLPFTQVGADTSGLGLGLSIARQCVEANKGAITVRDVPGIGCVFTIDLPRHRAR